MKRFLPKSEFKRNVLTLFTGTVIAQSIPIAVSPILTRLYSPKEFGLFALYMGLAAILSVIVTGRYDLAVMLPKEDDDAANLVILSLIITAVISLLFLLIIFMTSNHIALFLEKPEIEKWLFFIPVTMFLTGIYQSLTSWSNRQKRYVTLAKNRVYQSATISIIQVIGGGIVGGEIFLIIGDLIGKVISTFILFLKTWKKDSLKFVIAKNNKLTLAKRYKKFPIFDAGATLANVSSYQIQNILFPFFYGLTSAGFYFLVLRVLQAPLSLISTSLTDVYKQKLTDPITTTQDLRRYFEKIFVLLFSVGLPLLIIFMVIGERLFIIFFGIEWRIAGEYAVILSPMFFIKFIASPLSYFLYLKEKQEIDLFGNFTFLLCGFLSIILSSSIESAVLSISITFSLLYIGYISYSAKLAGLFNKDNM